MGSLLHLGYVLNTMIYHQATNRWIGTIFVGPYITRLAKGINLFGGVDHDTTIGQFNPIIIVTLWVIGLFNSWGVIIHIPIDTHIAKPSCPDNSPFSGLLIWSLQKIAYHCEVSSPVNSTFSHSIGVDSYDLSKHHVDSGDTLTAEGSEDTTDATKSESKSNWTLYLILDLYFWYSWKG